MNTFNDNVNEITVTLLVLCKKINSDTAENFTLTFGESKSVSKDMISLEVTGLRSNISSLAGFAVNTAEQFRVNHKAIQNEVTKQYNA
ncbi:Hypothetical protein KNT65_gp162 [Escherichia phage EcS1]|uniref:Uncharacterized protein n=1 Tax=Escherichia phage EcS1 TaxID=2083276 RepID=A0A2Z5ZD59_9CAUD|nr:Hypothetical protein KNT65_gp162 [Escherichia phage EcS1]BBC78331.1 Hypothetical protein [Escherichia phage EcS1]